MSFVAFGRTSTNSTKISICSDARHTARVVGRTRYETCVHTIETRFARFFFFKFYAYFANRATLQSTPFPSLVPPELLRVKLIHRDVAGRPLDTLLIKTFPFLSESGEVGDRRHERRLNNIKPIRFVLYPSGGSKFTSSVEDDDASMNCHPAGLPPPFRIK